MINKLIKLKDNTLKPKWFLRQAGRHIPEYYLIRNKHDNFIGFCLNEKILLILIVKEFIHKKKDL